MSCSVAWPAGRGARWGDVDVVEVGEGRVRRLAFDDAWTRGERRDRDATVALVVAELDAVEAELARNA
jgi:hypothetical protein